MPSRSSGRDISWLQIAFALIFVALLLWLVVLLSRPSERFETVMTQPLLSAADGQTDVIADWTEEGGRGRSWRDPSGLHIVSEDAKAGRRLVRRVSIPPGVSALSLEAMVGSRHVVPGASDWQAARLYLAAIDRTGRYYWNRSHVVVKLTGDREPRSHRRTFLLPDAARMAEIGLDLKQTTGHLIVQSLTLAYLAEKTTVFLFQVFSVSAMALMIAITFKDIVLEYLRRSSFGRIAFFVLLSCLFVLPGSVIVQIYQEFFLEILGKKALHQAFHLVLFCTLSLCLFSRFRSLGSIINLAALMIAFCMFVEAAQSLVPDRSVEFDDILVNLLGILAAGLILWLRRSWFAAGRRSRRQPSYSVASE